MALRSLMLSRRNSTAISLFLKRFGFSEFHFLSPNSALNSMSASTSNSGIHSRLAPETITSTTFSTRLFSTEVKKNFLTNFSLPSDSDSDEDERSKPPAEAVEKPKLPPPYDPFNKKPEIDEPKDPKNLQEIFHNMRTDGLMQSAAKMFDGLSKQGLTHEALQLFKEINEKGKMPDVIGHTAVIEAYCNAGNIKEAHKVYLRMLAAGVLPNAYTYQVLIKGMAKDVKMVGEARRFLMEMVKKGMRLSADAYAAVAEGLVREGRESECREMVKEMKGKGFAADETAVREALESKRGPVFRTVMEILFGK